MIGGCPGGSPCKKGYYLPLQNTLGSNEVAISFQQSIISKHEEHYEDPLKSFDFGIMDVYTNNSVSVVKTDNVTYNMT